VENRCDVSVQQVCADRLNEFETALKIAADRLGVAIDRIVAGIGLNDLDAEEVKDSDRVLVDKDELESAQDACVDAPSEVSDAIFDFRWDIERELRAFKQALRR
jgi:hypothetical protein